MKKCSIKKETFILLLCDFRQSRVRRKHTINILNIFFIYSFKIYDLTMFYFIPELIMIYIYIIFFVIRLFNLTKAFNTVNYDILLYILSSFGLNNFSLN